MPRNLGGIFSAIEVRLDLHKACDKLNLSRDQRALITELYNQPALSSLEAGWTLGWSTQRLDRTVRSLRPDRAKGAALREFLGAYKIPEKTCQASVREITQSAA